MFWKEAGFQARKDSHGGQGRSKRQRDKQIGKFRTGSGVHPTVSLSLWETRMNKITQTTLLQKGYIPALECLLFRIVVNPKKGKISDGGNPDAECSLTFSDEDEAQDEENEVASVARKK